MQHSTRSCPTCGATYHSGEPFCPHDFTPLSPIPASETGSHPLRAGSRWAFGVLAAVALLGVGLLVLKSVAVYRIEVVFEQGHSLRAGDRVYVLNADRGRVERAVLRNGRFVATLRIEPDAAEQLRTNTKFHITYDEFFNGKMCVTTLLAKEPAPALLRGSVVRGIDSDLEWYEAILATRQEELAARFLKRLASYGVQLLLAR